MSFIKRALQSILICAIMIVIFNYNGIVAKAEKSYDIKSADFYIELLEDGNAKVVETWKVNYSGDFSRFYKSLQPKDINKLESYDNLEIKYVKIEDEFCDYVNNSNKRDDYTYTVNKDGINWFYKVHNGTVEYKVAYTLTNSIKQIVGTDDNRVVFTYRPICVGFDKEIENVGLLISAPDSANMSVRYFNKSNWNCYESGDIIKLDNNEMASSGLVKISILANRDCFGPNLTEISIEEVNNVANSNEEYNSNKPK